MAETVTGDGFSDMLLTGCRAMTETWAIGPDGMSYLVRDRDGEIVMEIPLETYVLLRAQIQRTSGVLIP